jgi:LPXTG-motif cell wall-anchored protein
LQRFIDGSQYALDEFKLMYKNAQCTIAPTGGSGAISTTTNETGLNSTTWALIIGSSVLLFGFVGFLIYKKYKK